MFYPAIVIDNSQFFEKGIIWVRVSGFYNRPMKWDLSKDPTLIDESINKDDPDQRNDLAARVLSPLGGGRNYGVFFLPQVNEKGVVAFLMGNHRKPIWLGSLFGATYRSFRQESEIPPTGYVNIPSDKPEAEGENQDGAVNGLQNLDAEDDVEALGKNIIIRTKRTKPDSADNLNWEKVSTSNIISVGENKIRIRHFSKDDGWDETTPKKWQEILVHKDPDNSDKDTISIEVVNNTDSKTGSIKITEESASIQVGDNIITIKDDGNIEITSVDANVTLVGNPKIILNAENDTAVRYSKLINIINAFENHVHITQGSAGPTSEAKVGPPGAVIIASDITKNKNELESENIKIE